MYSYSKRLTWAIERNELSHLTAEQRAAGTSLLDLTSSNPTSSFSPYPHSSLKQAFSNVSDYGYDPDPLGMRDARSEVVRYYAQRNIAVEADQIVLTASTSEAYAMLFKLFCDAGDQILIPTPSYPLFDYLAALECVEAVPYRLQYDGVWHIDFADLRRCITPRSKAIVIVNPNNPTGTYLTEGEREELFAIACAHGLPIISDEVFMDYAIRPRSTTCKTLIGCDSVLSFSLNGLSKVGGMPQVKLAWIVMNGPRSALATARERLELVSDTYLSVSTPVQRALGGLFEAAQTFQTAVRDRLGQNLAMIDEVLLGSPVNRLHLDGGWSAILQLPGILTEDEWVTALIKDGGVLVQPGYFFDIARGTHIVISLLTETEMLKEGLRRLIGIVEINSAATPG